MKFPKFPKFQNPLHKADENNDVILLFCYLFVLSFSVGFILMMLLKILGITFTVLIAFVIALIYVLYKSKE